MTDIASLAFSIDTSDVEKAESALDGLNQAGNKTEATARSVEGSMAGIASEAASLSKSAASASDSLSKFVASEQQAARAGTAFVQALQDQVALFGKSADEALRYKAAQLDVQNQAEGLIVQLTNLRRAQDAVNDAILEEATITAAAAQSREAVSTSQYNLIQGLREQIALFGKSSLEIAEFEAKLLGASDAAQPLINQLRELQAAQRASEEAAQSEANAQRQAEAARQSSLGQQESFLASLREQNALFGKSSLDAAEYRANILGISDAASPLIANLRQLSAAQTEAARAAAVEAQAQRDAATARMQADNQRQAFLSGLREQAELLGKSREEVLAYRAAQLGLSNESAQYIARIREFNNGLNSTGVSAAQTTAALRMLPAQITDVVTQLAGGASPFLVLIQQGGQIKDSFGGVRETFEALSKQVRGMFGSVGGSDASNLADIGAGLAGIADGQAAVAKGAQGTGESLTDIADGANATAEAAGNAKGAVTGLGISLGAAVGIFAAAAAAAAALAIAWKQGSEEAVEFNKQLILTGNYAGTSTGQLQGMAAEMDTVAGTQRQAAAALAEIVGTGKFAVDQIEEIGTAAVAMEDATGKAISETVSEFKRLADEPSKAAAKLNEQYHFLTASVYEQITALEEQGDAAGAAQLAIDAYAEAMTKRAAEIESGLGLVEKAWKGIKDGAAEAWDEMLGVGRPETPEERLQGLTKGNSFNLGRLAANGLVLGPVGAAAEAYKQYQNASLSDEERQQRITAEAQAMQDRDEAAWREGLKARQEQLAVSAQQAFDGLLDTVKTNKEKRQKLNEQLDRDIAAIRAANPKDERLSSENIAQARKAIDEKFKDPKAPKEPKTKAFQDDAGTKLLIQLREQQAELETQLLTTDKISDAQKRRAAFESEIADIKEKKVLTADQKSLLANESAIKAQLDKNVAVAEEVRLHQESIKFQERAAQIQASIQSSMTGRQEQQQRQLDAFGMGKSERERVESERAIFREFRRYQDQLNKDASKNLLGSDEYEKATADIKRGLNDALQANKDYYAKLDQLREDSTNGQKAALEDYLDSAKDVAGQTYDLFTNAFSGLEDTVVEFVKTGKLSFADLADSIIADLIRIEVRKAVAFAAGGDDGRSGLVGLLSLGASAAAGYFGGDSSAAGASQSGYTSDAYNTWKNAQSGHIPGRAGGGSVAANEVYQVGENNMPEILRSGGRQYLIPGDDGQVIPMKGWGGRGNVSVGQMVFPNVTDRRSAEEATIVMQRRLGQLIASTGRAM